MIERTIGSTLIHLSKKFPVVAILGPRQSGKTTLAKYLFPKKAYVSLEDLDMREAAKDDPRGFLASYQEGAIFDEIQRVPHLLSYLQTFVDERQKPGLFVITGSQNILLQEHLSQTLAGRAVILKLLPFSFEEIKSIKDYAPKTLEGYLFRGGYPRIYDKKLKPPEWYPSYTETYLERDVRMIKNISDLHLFQKFVKLCAGRVGQLLNLSSIGNECGLSHNTARSWLSILETSYLVFLLKPHHENFNKRIIKMPKLYFYDTGLLCSLLGIHHANQLNTHYLKGSIFESFVVSELIKKKFNRGENSNIYFWRDKSGYEIDVVIEENNQLYPLEIKVGKTVNRDFFKNLEYWNKISKWKSKKQFLVYGGEQRQERNQVKIIGWQDISSQIL